MSGLAGRALDAAGRSLPLAAGMAVGPLLGIGDWSIAAPMIFGAIIGMMAGRIVP